MKILELSKYVGAPCLSREGLLEAKYLSLYTNQCWGCSVQETKDTSCPTECKLIPVTKELLFAIKMAFTPLEEGGDFRRRLEESYKFVKEWMENEKEQ